MNYRTATLLATESLSGSGTKTIDINVADIISRMIIHWGITKSATGMQSYCHKDITKIELVDGSEVLHSLDGGQNQALCIFDRKAPCLNEGIYIGANEQLSFYGIDFGRYLFDPLLAFDPKKFRNPQLKISYDSNVSDTGVSAGNLAVTLELFDEKVVSPMGFLSAKQLYSYTPASNGAYEYILLPTDRVIRRMLIQGYAKAFEPWYQVNAARLDEDNDKRVVFDWDMEEYFKVRQSFDPMIQEPAIFQSNPGGQDIYITPTDYWAHVVGVCSTSGSTWGYTTSGKGGYIDIVGSTSIEVRGLALGWLPNHCFNFPFGEPQDIGDWYDVTKVGSLRLRLKSGAGYSGSECAVVLQQLRKY